jgi:hypothetical protein
MRAVLYHPSGPLSGSSAGIFTGPAGSGSIVATMQTISVSTSAEHTIGNGQLLGLLNSAASNRG